MLVTIILLLFLSAVSSRPFYEAPFNSILSSIKKFGHGVKTKVENGVGKVSSGIGSFLKNSAKSAKNHVNNGLDYATIQAAKSIENTGESVADFEKTGASFISSKVHNGINGVHNLTSNLGSDISNHRKYVSNHLSKGFGDVASEVGIGLQQAGDGLVYTVKNGASFLSTGVQNGIDTAQQATSSVGNFLSRTATTAGDAIGRAGNEVVKAAPDIGKGLLKAGETAIEIAKIGSETARSIAKNSVGLNRSILSDVTDWFGQWATPLMLGLGIILGLVLIGIVVHYSRKICGPCCS